MLAAQRFDAAHFAAVHDRTSSVRLPSIAPHRSPAGCATRPGDRQFAVRPSVAVVRRRPGRGRHHELGRSADTVTGFFRRARSYIWIAAQPLTEHQTLVEIIPFAPRSRGRLARALLQPLGLSIRRRFTRGFMQDDIDRLGGIRYNPAGLVETDRLMIDFFAWMAALPRPSGESGAPAPTTPAVVACPVNGFDFVPVPSEDWP